MDKTTKEYANKLAEEIKGRDFLNLFDDVSFSTGYMAAISECNVKGLIEAIDNSLKKTKYALECEGGGITANHVLFLKRELTEIQQELEKARK